MLADRKCNCIVKQPFVYEKQKFCELIRLQSVSFTLFKSFEYASLTSTCNKSDHDNNDNSKSQCFLKQKLLMQRKPSKPLKTLH